MKTKRQRWAVGAVLLAGILFIGIALLDWRRGDGIAPESLLDSKSAKPGPDSAPAQFGRKGGLQDSADASSPVAVEPAEPLRAEAPPTNMSLKRNKPLTVGEKVGESSIRLSGMVIDAHTKAPLGAALVQIAPIRDAAPPAEMESRLDGTFSLAVQKAPRYEIRATAEGYRGYSQSGLVADSSRSDLVLELSPHWEISGIVLDEESRPVEGAAVWVRTAHQTTRQAKAFSKTDRSGRFTVEGWISAGSYLVGASHSRYRSLDPVRLAVPEQLEATLYLQSTPPDEQGSISGQVTDSKGLAVAGAKLSLVNSQDFMTLQTALTDADGFYGMPGIRGGSYTVTCQAEGFSGGAAGNFKEVQVLAGQASQVDFRLESPSFLDGIVQDEQGLPVVRAMVKLKVDQGGGRAAFSDSEGRFSLQDIPPGRHAVRMTHRDFLTHEEVLSFPSSGEYKVIMSRGISLSGALRDLNGAPIPRFKLSMIPEGADRPLKTAQFDSGQGDFLLSGLRPGRYRLEFALPQSEPRWGQVELQESKQVLILIDLADFSAPPRILEEGGF